MKINCFCVGDTPSNYLQTGIDTYNQRLSHFVPSWGWTVIPNIKNAKNMSEQQLKEKEGELILKKLEDSDFLVLLDERGKQYSSPEFADLIAQWQLQSHKRVVFLVGGAYGFSDAVYARAQAKMSLSRMTFSHLMVRLFFAEQLYRAFSILHNQPYHHA
jgi:23S rRNA (pseudouridine1915-N3)-methyltransferase